MKKSEGESNSDPSKKESLFFIVRPTEQEEMDGKTVISASQKN